MRHYLDAFSFRATLDVACADGAVQFTRNDLGIAGSVMEHLFFDGLRARPERLVDGGAIAKRRRHVEKIALQIVEAAQFHAHAVTLSRKHHVHCMVNCRVAES